MDNIVLSSKALPCTLSSHVPHLPTGTDYAPPAVTAQVRAGHSSQPGFEGGQLPLIKGLPMKRGFTNIFKVYYSLVGLDDLNAFEDGQRVTPEDLAEKQILRKPKQPVKVVGNGEITKAVTVAAHKFTRSAKEKIEAAGGRVEEL